MQQLTHEGRRIVIDLAHRHGFSSDAVTSMLAAVSAGYGIQAQFNHAEFGGMGQWSSGGMIMIGDMFNNSLKGRVGSLCQDLAGLIYGQPLFATPAQSQRQYNGVGQDQLVDIQHQVGSSVSGSSFFVQNGQYDYWWPVNLGIPGSIGAQNNLRYAYFPGSRRLAIDLGGKVTVYDTGDHQISGYSQQQGGDQSITFTSQFGMVRVADLRRVNTEDQTNERNKSSKLDKEEPDAPEPAFQDVQTAIALVPASPELPVGHGTIAPATREELLNLIEKLADLHKKGILSDTEYEAKKGELLRRL